MALKALISLLLLVFPIIICEETKSANNFEKVVTRCLSRDEIVKCLKIEAVKVANRAISLKKFSLIDGVSLISDEKERAEKLHLNDSKLEKLDSEELDDLLSETSSRFFKTHQLEIKIPNIFQSETENQTEVEEGRKRKRRRGGGGAALYWALAIKGTFLAMAYKGIAVMSGMALIMGKMALLLSAILGLKKLVSTGQEQTTIEIIKKPKETHSYTNSYEEEDYHKGHGYDRGDNDVTKTRFKTYLP